MTARQCKPKKCRQCNDEFYPWNSAQVCCGPSCAIEYVRNKQETQLKRDIRTSQKIERKKHREAKERLKTRSDWLKEAQTACNAYIRERDKGLPCISCGNTRDVKYCAGHFKTRGGNPELRFHPFNINRQCDWYCNLNLSGNIAGYRPNLIKKIGLSNVEWLEGPQEVQNWTIEEIIEIKLYYREQLKILKSAE